MNTQEKEELTKSREELVNEKVKLIVNLFDRKTMTFIEEVLKNVRHEISNKPIDLKS
jgi:hypothetical protein